jgi:hypothetical protein
MNLWDVDSAAGEMSQIWRLEWEKDVKWEKEIQKEAYRCG